MKGTRTGTVIAQAGVPYFVGNYGTDLARFGTDGSSWMPLPLPAALVAFAFDPSRPHAIVALLNSGELVRIDPRSGAVTARTRVLAAVPAGGSVEGAVSPSLTVGLNAAYVASPEGEVLEIDLQRFAVARHLAVGGTPLSIAVAGNVRA